MVVVFGEGGTESSGIQRVVVENVVFVVVVVCGLGESLALMAMVGI